MNKPRLISLQMCDTAVKDAITKKWSLIGLFSAITVNKPVCFWVFFTLADIVESNEVGLSIIKADTKDGKPFTQGKLPGKLKAEPPLYKIDFAMCFDAFRSSPDEDGTPIMFSETGTYDVIVFVDGQEVGRSNFIVH